MATYGTDLTTLTDAESGGTWTEFSSYAGGGTPAADGENFIQGTDCMSQTTGVKTGLVFSIVYDAGSDISGSFSTNDVVLIWSYFAVGSNLLSYSSGGVRVGIGSTLSDIDAYAVSGNDRTPNPYGGWYNFVVDPTIAGDYTTGTGNGGAWRYFGMIVGLTLKISKGTPHAVDAIRYGRGEIYCTGTGCTFTGFAQYNDYNDATNGYNRLGLFQDKGGTYLWKGLLSFGQTGTSATFSDSNKTIVIDDTPKVYAAFNKIEINNASSNITWTNITFIALGTVAPGNFEMIADAIFNATGCVFNNMGTFIFDSNTNIDACTFNACGQITTGNCDLTNSVITDSTNSSAVKVASPAEAAKITGCTFNSDGTGHAIEIGGTAANITLSDNIFVGYDTADPGTSTNKAIFVNIATGTMTITVSGGSGLSQLAVRSAGATVTVNSDVTVTFTGLKDYTEVRVYKVSDDSVVAGIEDATDGTTNNRSFAWSAPAGTEVYYVIHNYENGFPVYQSIRVESYTVPTNNTSIAIKQIIDRNFA